MWNIHVKLYEIRTSGSRGDRLKKKVYGRTDDGHRPITKPHLEPSAQVRLIKEEKKRLIPLPWVNMWCLKYLGRVIK